jgi:hypothetical protein
VQLTPGIYCIKQTASRINFISGSGVQPPPCEFPGETNPAAGTFVLKSRAIELTDHEKRKAQRWLKPGQKRSFYFFRGF